MNSPIDPLHLLVPRPQQAQLAPAFTPPRPFTVSTPESTLLDFLLPRLEALYLPTAVADEAFLKLRLLDNQDSTDESYRLRLGVDGGEVIAASPAGLFYGAATLLQWLRIHRDAPTVPGLVVEDRPDFRHRGVMLDISRDKVPTLDTLFTLVDRLAELKYNQFQLYMEHTFAYAGHEVVWRDASPLTGEDIERLEAHCQSRHMELVPNQNSFGHFHRWLRHEAYRPLAECPEGIDHPFSEAREPFSLCPLDPAVPPLLEDLYDQLLPHFKSSLFNVGLDETLDLGQGRSAEACERSGRTRVYLDFLQKVHRLATERGRRILFWGDIILKNPELIPELPEDAIALEWGYDADHPFAEDCGRFAEAGLDFYVCPGTSSWHSFGARLDNALTNLAQAALHGHAAGGLGYLVTDWGDNGHLQPLSASYLPLLAGAAFAWNTSTANEDAPPVARWFDVHLAEDPTGTLGGVYEGLGNAYCLTGAPPPGEKSINGSALFFNLVFALRPEADRRIRGMTLQTLEQTREHLLHTTAALPKATPRGPEADQLPREAAWIRDTLLLACDVGSERLRAGNDVPLDRLPGNFRRQAAETVHRLVSERRALWLMRNRPGGMGDSLHRLERLVKALGADQ